MLTESKKTVKKKQEKDEIRKSPVCNMKIKAEDFLTMLALEEDTKYPVVYTARTAGIHKDKPGSSSHLIVFRNKEELLEGASNMNVMMRQYVTNVRALPWQTSVDCESYGSLEIPIRIADKLGVRYTGNWYIDITRPDEIQKLYRYRTGTEKEEK